MFLQQNPIQSKKRSPSTERRQPSVVTKVPSGRTDVMRSCRQVQLVGVVVEHQQTVEVLSAPQDSVFAPPP